MIEMFEWKPTSRLWGGCMSYSVEFSWQKSLPFPCFLKKRRLLTWNDCIISSWSILISRSLQSPISCKELGDIACRSNVSPFGQRLKFTCVLVIFVVGWLVSRVCKNQPLPQLWDGCWSPYLRLMVSVFLNEVGIVFDYLGFGFAKCILFNKRRQTWQTTCKINSWELRPDLYLVHRKGCAVTVKSSRAVALQGFLVTLPSR